MSAPAQNQLGYLLQSLKLPGIRKSYQEMADLARKESMSHEEYLLAVIQQEHTIRHQNRTARLLKESRLPLGKNLDSFDRKRLPLRIDMQLSALLDGSFLKRAENLLVFGNPGSGKTHLVCALGHQLVSDGYRVLFKSTHALVQELLSAKRDLKLPRFLKQLGKYQALILDDIGYIQQDQKEMEVLFTLLADRYERQSIIITSNLPFSGWEKIFKDPMTTAAAIDRLVHHSIILELNLPSYRLEHAKREKAAKQSLTKFTLKG